MDSDVEDALEPTALERLASFKVFSPGVLAPPPPTTDPKSRALPGDFGALEAPNEANAPEPRPKALDAPAVGEGIAAGVAVLKGFLLP